MAGFTDILGSLIQQGMSQSSTARAGNALGAGSGSLNDLLGSLGKMAGGTRQGQAAGSGGQGGSLSDLFGSLSEMVSGAKPGGAKPGGESGGFLDDLLGSLGGGGRQADSGGALDDLLSNLGNNKAMLGGLGALAGALLGGGKKSVGGAAGGGALAMLASLALSALKKGGQAPSRPPGALVEPQTHEDELALENDAEVIVKAMINAAKADGRIDDAEIEKIVGKLDDDGLTQQEKDFFVSEANKPMDLDGVISLAAGRPDMAAQLYAASLLAIESDTAAEQRYMQQLAAGLGLQPQVTSHIERTLGV